MDPGARRFLWDVINSVVREHKSVVLTSHRYFVVIVNSTVPVIEGINLILSKEMKMNLDCIVSIEMIP